MCGEHPTITSLIDYEQFCGIGQEEDLGPEFDIEPIEVKKLLDAGKKITILDVRNPPEFEIGTIEGSVKIPLPELQDRLGELDSRENIVVHCHHGPRSTRAVQHAAQVRVHQGEEPQGWHRSVERRRRPERAAILKRARIAATADRPCARRGTVVVALRAHAASAPTASVRGSR